MGFARFLILAPLAFILLCHCQHQPPHPATLARIPAANDPRLAVLDRGGDPNFHEVLALLKLAPSGTIAEGLRKIKSAYPEYMTNHTLMYHSESLQSTDYRYDLMYPKAPQGNDFLHPRAIVYGSSARTIITFNGNSKYHGYSTIETLEFDDQNEYQMREIIFRKEPGAARSNPRQVRKGSVQKIQRFYK